MGSSSHPEPRTHVPSPAPALATGPDGGRDAHLDNVKFALIVLVVVGHALTDLRGDSELATTLYRAIYLFHMPAFVLITGHLSARVVDARRGVKMLRALVFPYLLFQTLYLVVDRTFAPEPAAFSLLRPYWLMWFLMAVIVWRLVTPLLLSLRWPLLWALGISLVAPSLPDVGRVLAVNRVLGMLPFFVAGLVLPAGALTRLRRRPWAVGVGLVGVAVLAAATVLTDGVSWDVLYYTADYEDDTLGFVTGAARQTLVLALGAVGTIAAACLVPARRRWWTVLGAGSIGAYLLHGFVVRGARWTGLTDGLSGPGDLAVVVTIAVLATALLCAPPVVRTLRRVISPELAWAVAPPAEDDRSSPVARRRLPTDEETT